MAMSRRETEIKLAFPSPQAARDALVRIGAQETRPRDFEDNVLFDLAGGPLARAGRVLRLRRTGGRSMVTFKGPSATGTRHKVREEHESEIADGEAFGRILDGAGFAPVYRYQKYRTTFAVLDVEACLDETALGTFVELEGSADAIDRVASLLGADASAYLRETYRELQEKDAAERGIPAGDLLFPGGGGA